MAKAYTINTGRWGYGSQYGPNSAGINTKRLQENFIQENPLVLCKREILGLLAKGHREEALNVLVNCCASEIQKEIFLTKHFIVG